jgi:hypothetical protein
MGGTIRQTSVEGYMEIFGAENLDKLLQYALEIKELQ